MNEPVKDGTYDWEAAQAAFARGEYQELFRYAMPFAEAGNSDAQCMIALLYQCGQGDEQDGAAAEKWLIAATESGNPIAWNNLGVLYEAGWDGTPRNPERAAWCFRRAQELGLDFAVEYPPPVDL